MYGLSGATRVALGDAGKVEELVCLDDGDNSVFSSWPGPSRTAGDFTPFFGLFEMLLGFGDVLCNSFAERCVRASAARGVRLKMSAIGFIQ